VEAIELVQREQVDELLDERLGHEMAHGVEHRAAPAEARPVLDLHAGQLPRRAADRGLPVHIRRQQLAEGLRAVEQASGRGRADFHAILGDGQQIAFRPEPVGQRRVDVEANDVAARAGRGGHHGHEAQRGRERAGKLLANRAGCAGRGDRRRLAEPEGPGAAGHVQGQGYNAMLGHGFTSKQMVAWLSGARCTLHVACMGSLARCSPCANVCVRWAKKKRNFYHFEKSKTMRHL